MYDILFAPISKRKDEEEIAYDWAILYESIPSPTEVATLIANEMASDLINGEPYAYRLIEHGEW